mgnify:CR=1 FL=1
METPTIPLAGIELRISPSLTVTLIGSLQSRQTLSIWIVLPGNNQQTARDSKAHCPHHLLSPSTVIL